MDAMPLNATSTSRPAWVRNAQKSDGHGRDGDEVTSAAATVHHHAGLALREIHEHTGERGGLFGVHAEPSRPGPRRCRGIASRFGDPTIEAAGQVGAEQGRQRAAGLVHPSPVRSVRS
jgi:hypothetical protein